MSSKITLPSWLFYKNNLSHDQLALEIRRMYISMLFKMTDADIDKSWIPSVANNIKQLKKELASRILISEGPRGPIYYDPLTQEFF